MWLEFWNLVRDPFPGLAASYVAVASHEKIVSSVVDATRSGDRQTILTGEPGVGKTTLLGQVIDRIRTPGLRIARSHAPRDEPTLLDDLRRSLRFGTGSPNDGVHTFSNAVRLVHAQRGRLVIVVDDAHHLNDEIWDRLAGLDPSGELTIIRVQRSTSDDILSDNASIIQLGRLTRQESRDYLTEKLVRAGRTQATFSAGGSTRLHSLAMGLPRSLDRLARAALEFGAQRNEPIINEDIIACVSSSTIRETLPLIGSSWLGLQ